MKILAVSDLHAVGLLGLDRAVTGCALALCAGDLVPFGRTRGNEQARAWMRREFCAWCARHPDTRFCVIAGECDGFAARGGAREIPWPDNVTWLDEWNPSAEVCGLKIFCAGTRADDIPDGVDILLTHEPPCVEGYNVDVEGRRNRHQGRDDLTDAIRRARPRVVVCGHVHGGAGQMARVGDTTVLNVSRVRDNRGAATCRPVTFEADVRDGQAVFTFADDAAAGVPACAVSGCANTAAETKAIERAEKILFKAARSINKHVAKGDFTPNLHYINQLGEARALLRPLAERYAQVRIYLDRLDEVEASRAAGWRRSVGPVPRFGERT